MYSWHTHKYPQIYGFKRICIFHQKHICMLWHLFAICIYKLPVILWTPRHSCARHFRDSADANRFTNASFSAGNLSAANHMSAGFEFCSQNAWLLKTTSFQCLLQTHVRYGNVMSFWGRLARTGFVLRPWSDADLLTVRDRCDATQALTSTVLLGSRQTCFHMTSSLGANANILPKTRKSHRICRQSLWTSWVAKGGSGKSPDSATKSPSWQPCFLAVVMDSCDWLKGRETSGWLLQFLLAIGEKEKMSLWIGSHRGGVSKVSRANGEEVTHEQQAVSKRRFTSWYENVTYMF